MSQRQLQPITCTISASGTTSTSGHLQNYSQLSIYVPPLDLCNLTIQATNDGVTFSSVVDSVGVKQLVIPSTTGDFILDNIDCGRIAGSKGFRFFCSAAQNTGARTFLIYLKNPYN